MGLHGSPRGANATPDGKGPADHVLVHLGTDKPLQWTDLFPEWQPLLVHTCPFYPAPEHSSCSVCRGVNMPVTEERLPGSSGSFLQELRVSDKERRIETEGGKAQGGAQPA